MAARHRLAAILRDACARAHAPQDEGRRRILTLSGRGLRLFGKFGRPALGQLMQQSVLSPRMNASFLARLHPLSFRSASMALVIRSNHSEKTGSTGRRDEVYPGNVPALCWAILIS